MPGWDGRLTDEDLQPEVDRRDSLACPACQVRPNCHPLVDWRWTDDAEKGTVTDHWAIIGSQLESQQELQPGPGPAPFSTHSLRLCSKCSGN